MSVNKITNWTRVSQLSFEHNWKFDSQTIHKVYKSSLLGHLTVRPERVTYEAGSMSISGQRVSLVGEGCALGGLSMVCGSNSSSDSGSSTALALSVDFLKCLRLRRRRFLPTWTRYDLGQECLSTTVPGFHCRSPLFGMILTLSVGFSGSSSFALYLWSKCFFLIDFVQLHTGFNCVVMISGRLQYFCWSWHCVTWSSVHQ